MQRTKRLIAAPGWAAVYMREGAEILWPLVAWLRQGPDETSPLVGVALTPDGRGVVRADQIEGFRRYMPPAVWHDERAAGG